MKLGAIQSALRMVYPPRCIGCGDMVDSDFGLCGPCWRDTPFILGTCCDSCGKALPPAPEDDSGDEIEAIQCDACMKQPLAWDRGRAAFSYGGTGRRLVLALKYGDRQDVVRPAAMWMARAARPLLTPKTLIAPVPLHWLRLLKRRFNQSALLSKALAQETGAAQCPDLLVRPRSTAPLGGKSYAERRDTVRDAIAVHPKRVGLLAGRDVLLVDDVMTSGATFAAAAGACKAAGAASVSIVALARAGRDA